MDNTKMIPGDCIKSPNRRFSLEFQHDGNLVFYKDPELSSREPKWDAASYDATHVTFQDDGNLVAYKDGTPLWDSNTCLWQERPMQQYASQYTGGACTTVTYANENENKHDWIGKLFMICNDGTWGIICKDMRHDNKFSGLMSPDKRTGGAFRHPSFLQTPLGQMTFGLAEGLLVVCGACYATYTAAAAETADIVGTDMGLEEAYKLLEDIPGDNDRSYKIFQFNKWRVENGYV